MASAESWSAPLYRRAASAATSSAASSPVASRGPERGAGHPEGEADEIHDRGLGNLYQKAKTGDAMDFIRGNEIYNHLENTVDRLDDVADEIQGIVIEHV